MPETDICCHLEKVCQSPQPSFRCSPNIKTFPYPSDLTTSYIFHRAPKSPKGKRSDGEKNIYSYEATSKTGPLFLIGEAIRGYGNRASACTLNPTGQEPSALLGVDFHQHNTAQCDRHVGLEHLVPSQDDHQSQPETIKLARCLGRTLSDFRSVVLGILIFFFFFCHSPGDAAA